MGSEMCIRDRAFATLNLQLSNANEPLMHAVVRVADSMNAQAVVNTLWAFARLKVQPEDACRCLIGAAPRVAGSFKPRHVRQAYLGLEWLQAREVGGAQMKLALQAVGAAERRQRSAIET